MSAPAESRRGRKLPADLSAVKLALMSSRFRAETEGIELLRSEPIAVVGIGCRFPGGVDSPESFWDLLVRGIDAVTEMPPERAALGSLSFDPGGKPVRGGFLDRRIDLFDPAFFGIAQAEAARMDPHQRLLLEAAWEAIEDAGLTREKLAGSETGVFVGLTSQDAPLLVGRNLDHVLSMGLGVVHSMAANRLSYLLDLRGPSLEVDTACSSSLVAVHLACSQLRAGECDLALAGGVSLLVVPEVSAAYARLGLLSQDGRCKAFSAGADGFGRGEGCGVVVLKRLSDALTDRDPIRAVIRGSAVNQDGRSNGIAAPNGLAQRQVVRRALENAGVSPARLGYVEAHGAGTPIGDLIEVEALAEVLGGGGEPWCALGSVKTNIGHLEAAGGVASLIKAVLVLEHGAIPPSLHCRTLHPEIARLRTPFTVPCEVQPWPAERPRLAGVHSFGMGGTNAHAILEAAPSTPWLAPGEPDAPGAPARLLPLSGHTAEVLRERVRSLRDFLRGTGKSLPLADVCFTAAVRRSAHSRRLAAVARTTTEMANVLSAALEGEWDLTGRVLGDAEGLLAEMGELWAGGGSPDWSRLYPEGGRPVRLPVYPYQPSVCWWEGSTARAATQALQLQAGGTGLDSLELRPVPLRPPGDGEVQIRVLATGLSFRDVLSVLGMYPGKAGPPGNECAGRIVAVGAGVEGLRPGDEVVACAPGSFANLLTVDARLVAHKPEILSFAEAAALPIVFLTASEALLDVARLRAGERVLVHAAAGGVGMAALQLAQGVGAEVFATAGSPAKWELLASLGVRHVFDSRSAGFADRVREVTDGEGVHVVLNSLTGELLERSLEIMAPGGRFVEIGRREAWEPERVASFRPDVTYTRLDLAEEMAADPEAFGRRLRRLLDRFAAGELRPLPVRTYPLERAVEAFRFMARAQHVGKIVVVQEEAARSSLASAPPPAALLPSTPAEPPRGTAGGERRRLTEGSIREVVARLLGLAGPEEVDPRRPLGELGLGSLGAVELRNVLSSLAGRPLSAALVFNYPTVEALADLLSGEDRPAEAPVGRPGRGDEAVAPVRSRVRGQAADEPVAVIGIGCRFPGGVDGPEAFWKLLCAGVDTVTEVPAERWDVDAYYDPDPHRPGKMSSRWGSFLTESDRFDSAFFQIAPREAAAMDPQQRLLLEVAWEALENAGVQPDRLAGTATGVFVGMCSNSYWDLHMAHGGAGGLDGDFITGNIASVASGRLSYFLGLQGPSLTVDTACSSSLVAVHLACQSLRRKESDLALAGGVNLIFSPDFHMLSSRLGVMARDGRCKTFDAAADGYSRGEGCGVVVLKRLSDALADRDPILAVVRGSAVNQDGRSTALTAPNGRAQEAVVRAALEDAGLPPAAIGYVEAHGSATPLGDVIELHALAAVHGPERPEGLPLWVGSVKTNFGHLEASAGIAGLIKAALSVAHGQVPSNLHFRTPNPEVPFAELGLRVPGALEPWPAGEGPRRAGVSAFGLSGTNAHVILEEPPAPPRGEEGQPWQLLPLSARTREALDTATARLACHLREHPDLDLADVAFTLQTGRRRFAHRRAVLARDLAEAVAHLESLPPRRAFTQADPATERPLVFLFPGVGDHYAGMAAGLYRDEPVFREALDRCSEILLPVLGEPLPRLLFPAGVDGEVDGGAAVDLRRMLRRGSPPQDGAASRLSETAVAQPVVFAVEHALAQLLFDWGLRPHALVGYSLGEYVAACVAGVFPLEAALRLVAERARWIQELPPGAMLAIDLPSAELAALLPPDLSLAAVNGPSLCIVSGPRDAVAALERRLGEDGVVCTRLQATHAFHAREMEPLRGRLTELVRSLHPAPPRIPFLSNVTGTWITEEEATDPEYWARHLCQPVLFETAAAELLRGPSRLFLEVGPGQSLGAFLKQHPLCPPGAAGLVLPTLRHAYERQEDVPFLLATLGKLWLAGAEVDWAGIQRRAPRHRLALPTYPFERQRHWLAPAASSRPAAQPAWQGRLPDPADWFSLPVWKETAVPPPVGNGGGEAAPGDGPWLAFIAGEGLGTALVERLRRSGRQVVAVRAGAGFSDLGWGTLEIDPHDPADYQRVLRWLERPAARVLHLWGLDGGRTGFDAGQDRGFYSVLFLAQALARQAGRAPVEIHVVTSGLQKVAGNEELRPELATLIGLCRVVPQEHPDLPCRIIDVEPPGPGRNERLALDLLMAELVAATPEPVVAYRGASRWVQRFERLRLEAPAEPWPRLRQGGAYLVIGGMGGIGSALAARLARDLGAKLVLTGRSPLPERDAWESWQAAHGASDHMSRRITFLRELERTGAEVLAVQADAADETAMRHAVELAEERFGALHGVFHTAGLVRRKAFAPMTALGRADCAAHFQAKAQGLEVLERVLRGREPELVVLFSSLSAVLGGHDFAAYAAANSYLDAFAQARAGEYPARWLSIDWDTWQVEAVQEHLEEMGSQLRELEMTPNEGLEAFRRVLAGVAGPRAIHSLGDLGERLERWVRAGVAAPRAAEAQAVQTRPELATPYTAPRTATEATVAGLWQEVLGIERAGVHDDFLALGGHSLSALQILARLRQRLGVELPLKAVFEAPSPAALAALIDSLAPPQGEEEGIAMGEIAEGFL